MQIKLVMKHILHNIYILGLLFDIEGANLFWCCNIVVTCIQIFKYFLQFPMLVSRLAANYG